MSHINTTGINNMICKALIKSIQQLKRQEVVTDNKLKSSIFVYMLSEEFRNLFGGKYKINVVGYDEKRKKRTPGEWLLDIAITEVTEIQDSDKTISKGSISHKMIWAIESELNSGIKAFADDFGKLLCVKSDNYLFLNGLNQKTEEGRLKYIKRRTNTVVDMKKLMNLNNYYLAFFPSPAKIKGKSLWDDNSEEDLLKMIEVVDLGKSI